MLDSIASVMDRQASIPQIFMAPMLERDGDTFEQIRCFWHDTAGLPVSCAISGINCKLCA